MPYETELQSKQSPTTIWTNER